MRRTAARKQLTFGWSVALRWEELPVASRDQIRHELRGILLAVAEAAAEEGKEAEGDD